MISFFSIDIFLLDGSFYTNFDFPNGWFHIAVNYIGPNGDEGIKVYKNGVDETGDTKVEKGYSNPISGGRIVVGRFYTESDNVGTAYSSVWVDELIYFNSSLSHAEVVKIYEEV